MSWHLPLYTEGHVGPHLARRNGPKLEFLQRHPQRRLLRGGTLHGELDRTVLGVGLIPLRAEPTDYARAVFVLRAKDTSREAHAFESQLLQDAERVRERVFSRLPAKELTCDIWSTRSCRYLSRCTSAIAIPLSPATA